MPRNVNPGDVKIGHGKAAPDENALRPSLTGLLPVPAPIIGQAVVPVGALPGGLSGEALAEHIQDPKAAHMASAIEHDGAPDILISDTVEGALDELIGTVVKRPPFLGQWSLSTFFRGIPDWGFLKVRDASLENYIQAPPPPPLANLPAGHSSANVFPYYFTAPGPAQDAEFTADDAYGNPRHAGEDPATDWLWNTGLEVTVDPSMPSTGYGRCHIGGFTRDGDVGPDPLEVMRTARLYPRPSGIDGGTGRPFRVPVTLSGSIFPADRGVLALFHFPVHNRGDMQAEFLGQPLITDETNPVGAQGRVVAALLMGSGILSGGASGKCGLGVPCNTVQCDGGSGGIFGVGTSAATDKYDPFAYPGRASGQYNLQEIHTGLDNFGNELISPWNDFDDDAVVGANRTEFDLIPAPGQVRLGTDPDAGETPVSYGIPILGGTEDYFDVAPIAQVGSLGFPIKGDALILESNFFRYRLPVLKDYSPATGLKWTPRGDAGFTTQETFRYFEVPAVTAPTYPDGPPVLATLRSAGFYESGFDEDYWVWQVARYRHTFLMPSLQGVGLREEVGSYWLVHFKSEADFEKFAHLGIFPWDAADGYEVYGHTLVGAPPTSLEEDKDIVNEWPAATDPVSPDGPAPLFGYSSNPYHGLRSTIFLDPAGTALPAVNLNAYTWDSTSLAAGPEAIVWVSGVAYFTPRLSTDGTLSFTFVDIELSLDPGFWTSYRTNSDDLSVDDTTAPAILASVNPMFLNMAPWAYGTGPGTALSVTVPTGAPGVGLIPGDRFLGTHRIEEPFEYLGTNGSGSFTDANGPLDADGLQLLFAGPIEMLGDGVTPAFTRDATLRAYFRRPLNHIADNSTTLPFSANDGHGLVLASTDGRQVLYHSTKFDKTTPANGAFGNYVVAATGGALPNTSYSELARAAKDVGEFFLDETYRLIPNFSATLIGAGGNPYTAQAVTSLQGPGMGGWIGGPIEVPVKANLAATPWDSCSWLLMEKHLVNLSLGADPDTLDGLQVAGLPDRNPAQSAAVMVPFPSRGVLQYPSENYFPMVPEGGVHFAGVQPTYAGAAGRRRYVRAFDAAFSHWIAPYPLSVAGTQTVVLRIDGLVLADFSYTAPGPGSVTADKLALAVKVPGLTTWMDIGRQDGAGPGKQDMFLDGAGCQVAGPETYDFQDPDTGYVGCYVKVNVGPMASLFSNPALWSNYAVGSPLGESPLMVEVRMNDGAFEYNLAHKYVGPGFDPVEKPGAAPNEVRGLIGISLVHPTDTLVSP